MTGFDPRIVPPTRLAMVKVVQEHAACRLAGGAALAGIHLKHRLSRDLDLFFEDAEAVRDIVRELPELARKTRTTLVIARDARSHVRINAVDASGAFEIDLVHEPARRIEPPAFVSKTSSCSPFARTRASIPACSRGSCAISRQRPSRSCSVRSQMASYAHIAMCSQSACVHTSRTRSNPRPFRHANPRTTRVTC